MTYRVIRIIKILHDASHEMPFIYSWLHLENVTLLQNTLKSHDLHPCKVG